MQIYHMADELRSLLEADRKGAGWWDVASAGTGMLLYFIGQHIWSPAEGYLLLALLLGADFVSAALLAWRKGTFETRKALRVTYKLVAYTVLLFFAHNLAKYESTLAFLPQAVFLPLVLMLLLSLIKNLSLLGYLPVALAEILYRKIDVFKNTSAATEEKKAVP